jgi:hypothetical protein
MTPGGENDKSWKSFSTLLWGLMTQNLWLGREYISLTTSIMKKRIWRGPPKTIVRPCGQPCTPKIFSTIFYDHHGRPNKALFVNTSPWGPIMSLLIDWYLMINLAKVFVDGVDGARLLTVKITWSILLEKPLRLVGSLRTQETPWRCQ